MPMAYLRRLDPWLPPLLLMAAIYYLSDQPHLSSGLGIYDTIGRKLVHVLEYVMLCGLWWRALEGLGPRTTTTPALIAAVAVTVGYSIADEYHQTMVEGRAGSPLDVGIDALGATAAAVAINRKVAPRATVSRRDG